MKRIYALFLALYPREYRELFGPEVLRVFAEAAEEHKVRGRISWVRFLIVELSGAAWSAAGHWFDRFAARHHVEVTPPTRGGLFGAAQEAQSRVDLNLKRMKQAIADRDFAKARTYSWEEMKAREELRRLRDRYGFDDDELAVQ